MANFKKPANLTELFGRLFRVLIKNNAMSMEDFQYILGATDEEVAKIKKELGLEGGEKK